MEDKFYPALHLGAFSSVHEALSSVGISGHVADLLAADVCDQGNTPAAYEATISDFATDIRTVLVLAPRGDGGIDVCYGYPDLASDTEEEALLKAVNGIERNIAADDVRSPVCLMAFQLATPRRVLQ